MGIFDDVQKDFLAEMNASEPEHDLGFSGTPIADALDANDKADVKDILGDDESDIDPVVTKDEPPSWAQDIDRKLNILGTQKFSQPQPQEHRQSEQQVQVQVPQRQPQRVATDVDLEYFGQKMAQIEGLQQVQYLQAVNTEEREARAAYDSLLKRYPELSEHIKPEHIKQSVDFYAQRGQLGQKWEQKIEQSFFSIAGSHFYQEAQKAKAKPVDQVAAKRQERSKQVAATIPSAGGTHVPPTISLTPNTRGFSDAAKAFRAELDGTY